MALGRRTRTALLLALAVIAYAAAAWAVTPGFYDGIAPPAPYCWVSPPPVAAPCGRQPLPGHSVVRVGTQGVVDPGSVFTQDGQAAISFVAGTFTVPPAQAPVTIEITPQTAYPAPGGFQLATNVYCITSTSALVSGKDPLVTLEYSSVVPAPSDVYEYQPGATWRKVGNTGSAAPYYIATRVTSLGCFAGGYLPGSSSPGGSGGPSLVIVAGLAIAVVVLAGIPLLVVRRRGHDD